MHPVPEELLRGPFLVSRARELGVSEDVLRGQRFRTPWNGVRIPAQLPDDLRTRCTALGLLLPDVVFSHATAAELMGLWMPLGWSRTRVHVSEDRVRPRRGVRSHQASWRPGDTRELRGLQVTSPARTLCDLAAARWELTDLVVIADCLQRRGWATAEELRAGIGSWTPARGARPLRRVALLTRAGADSAMETRLRLRLAAAGLPEPEVNASVYDDRGGYLHQPDLSWPAWKVAADYDGAHHLTDVERRRRIDISRKEAMEEGGWVLRVLTATDVLRQPDRAVERVRRALRGRGAQV
jgi:hypothetical protein